MNKIDDYLRNGVVFEDICREDPRAAATYLKELQSRLDTAEQKLAKLHEIATTDPLCSKHGWQGNEGDPCAYCERDAALLRLDQIMKDGTEYAQDMEARLIKRVAQIDELQSQLDSVLVLLREVSESETWELGTDLNRRIEAAIKAPK